MKNLLGVVVLGLFLITPSWADDITDFQIEGMSVGDSLLDYVSKEEIKKNTHDWYDYIQEKKFLTVALEYKKSFKEYDIVDVIIKINDKSYVIYGLSGAFYLSNMDECLIKQKKVSSILSKVFSNAKKHGPYTSKHSADPSGKSKYIDISFKFKPGIATVTCYDFSDSLKDAKDFFSVSLRTDEFNKWLE